MKRIFTHISIILLLSLYQIAFASSGLFFNVDTIGSVLNITTTVPNHTYSSAGIKINTSGYNLTNIGSDCIPNKNGYCLFSVSDVTTKAISITGATGSVNITLCLNGFPPLSCQTYNTPVVKARAAYVANGRDGVSLCPINPNGTFASCTDSGNSGVAFNQLRGIALNISETILYVVNQGTASVLRCPVNANSTLGACADSGNTGVAFITPVGIALNPTATIAYVTNLISGAQYDTVLKCPINPNGTFGACSDSGNTGVNFRNPFGIVITSNGDFAYVTNTNSNAVLKCPINSDGTFGACSDSGNTGVVFSSPRYITLNTTETAAYVSNGTGNTVSFCPINPNGSFGACTGSGNTGDAFNGPRGIAVNPSNTFAYVANNVTSTVFLCPMNSNGTFGTCLDSGNTGVPFAGPQGIALITN